MILETTALISIGSWLGNKLLDKGFDSIYSKVTSKQFNKKFYEKVNQASDRLQEKYPDAFGGSIEYLFKQEDVFNELIKLLFLNSKVDLEIIRDKFDNETLPENFILEFINILRQELYLDKYFNDVLSSKEIYLTTVGIYENIEDVMKITTMSFEEIKNLTKLLESKFKSNFSQSEFIEKYKERLINNLSQVNFIGLGVDSSIKKGKRKNLEDLFVKPSFSTNQDNVKLLGIKFPAKSKYETLSFDEIFDYTKKLLILGNPGSGKSTISKFIAIKLCKNETTQFNGNSICEKIPFRIELRKYFAYKKNNQEGIIKYIRHLLEVEFGFSNILLEDLVHILKNHAPLVIFDGLDEIFDINDKISIKNDIENFSQEYPLIRTITTSRIIGYEDNALNEESTLRLMVNSFNDNQIDEYIRNWYQAEESDDLIRNIETTDLLSKINIISTELISNPLLLSLIVILYRNNLKIPESKLEIYQSCTKTLVDKWDISKNIEINLPEDIYKRKDTIFADLAYWQYSVLSSKDGEVTYQKAKNTIAKSLSEKLKLSDEFTSDLTADMFLEYAQKRSLYFDNNFTHKTFLEYYTAYWIFTNIEKKHKKKERNDLLFKYIDNPYWHIVLELLLNLIDNDQADNEIIDELITEQLNAKREYFKFFFQIFDTLKNSSLQIFKIITKISIEELLNNSTLSSEKSIYFSKPNSNLFYLLSKYFKKEYYTQSIQDSFSEMYFEKYSADETIVDSDHYEEAQLINLYLEVIRDNRNNNDNKYEKILFASKKNFLKDKSPYFYILSTLIYSKLEFESDPITFAEEFITLFGVKSFLMQYKATFSNSTYFPFQRIVLRMVLKNQNSILFDRYIDLINYFNIDKSLILKDIFTNSVFFSSQEEMENCLNKANTNSGQLSRDLFLALVYSINYSRYIGINDRIDLGKALKVINDIPFRRHLTNIIKSKNKSKAIKYITSKFNINENQITD